MDNKTTARFAATLAKLPRKAYGATLTKEWSYPASESLDVSNADVQQFAYDLRVAGLNCIAVMNFGAPADAENVTPQHPNGRTFPVLAGRAFHSPDLVRTAATAYLKAHPDAVAPWV